MTTAATIKDCDCGFIDTKDPTKSTFDSLFVFDFTQATSRQLSDAFIVSNYSVTSRGYTRRYMASNVQLSSSGLQLTSGPSTDGGVAVPSAEIYTKAPTFGYGSYTAKIQVGTVPGTAAAFFYYKNDTSEIDIEYVSKQTPATLRYSVKPQVYLSNGVASTTTYKSDLLNDTSTFSDWSFLWRPDAVTYGINATYLKSISTNVPQAPARIILNHWSDGNANFTGGPPVRDTIMTVKFMQAVYNDTQAAPLACIKTREACLVTDGLATGKFEGNAVGQCCVLVVLLWLFWSRSA